MRAYIGVLRIDDALFPFDLRIAPLPETTTTCYTLKGVINCPDGTSIEVRPREVFDSSVDADGYPPLGNVEAYLAIAMEEGKL